MNNSEITPEIRESDLRAYCGKFFNKNNFRPGVALVAEHFCISREEATQLINRYYVKKVLTKKEIANGK